MAAAKRTAVKEDLPVVNVDVVLQGKLRQGMKEANFFLIERADEVLLSFIALVSGRHLMLVGVPGTAKSRLAEILCMLIDGRIYNYQFNKYTSPEEVFGPLDIPSLTGAGTGKSKYLRVTDDMLPEADIAHLDELGKASTAIRNTLLKILNEGTIRNGGKEIKVPMLVAIASANEWIGEGDDAKEMGALFDRFTLRKNIRQISTPAGRDRLLFDDDLDKVKFTVKLTPQEIRQARAEAMQLPFTKRCKEVLKDILGDLQKEGIIVGDRRQRWSVSVARAAAYMAGSDRVEPVHLEVLQHVLWAEPIEQPLKAAAIVMKRANPAAAQITKLLGEAEEIVQNTDAKDLPVVIGNVKKLDEIKGKLESMADSDRRDAALDFVVEHSKNLRKAAMGE
jgi:MoxR-like ATPase